MDDLDGDSMGPCRCDPAEDEERGVFRAIQKVYASFYNDNAVLERLRRGVEEEQAGMAALAHHSYPDEIEMANGVATCLTTERGRTAERVTQAGAVSVTNPDSSAQPEVMDNGLVIRRVSSLVPLGATVMSLPGDYVELRGLLDAAASAYHEFYPGKTNSPLRPRPAATGAGLRQERGFTVGPVQIRTVFYPWEPNEGVILQTFELVGVHSGFGWSGAGAPVGSLPRDNHGKGPSTLRSASSAGGLHMAPGYRRRSDFIVPRHEVAFIDADRRLPDVPAGISLERGDWSSGV